MPKRTSVAAPWASEGARAKRNQASTRQSLLRSARKCATEPRSSQAQATGAAPGATRTPPIFAGQCDAGVMRGARLSTPRRTL